MCPECGSDYVRAVRYDYGVCGQTGYHDAGEGYTCLDCGTTGDADDLAKQSSRQALNASMGPHSAGGGGALECSPISLVFQA